VTLKGQTRDPVTLRALISSIVSYRIVSYLENYTWATDFKFGVQLSIGNAYRAHK